MCGTGTYPCKYDHICKQHGNFNPAIMLEKPIPHLNKCTHGGGPGCAIWRRLTNRSISEPIMARKMRSREIKQFERRY